MTWQGKHMAGAHVAQMVATAPFASGAPTLRSDFRHSERSREATPSVILSVPRHSERSEESRREAADGGAKAKNLNASTKDSQRDSSVAPLPQNDGAAHGSTLADGAPTSVPAQADGTPAAASTLTADADTKAAAKWRTKQKNAISDFLIKLAVVVVGLWAVFTFVLGLYQMDGQAMYPSLRDGDLVLTWRIGSDFVVGDVLTYEVDGRQHTARVVAQGGDVVELSDDGYLIVNGNVEAEETFYETEAIAGGVDYPYTVPDGSYFMLGDNRVSAIDSRSYGAIAASDIEGEVVTILRRRGI